MGNINLDVLTPYLKAYKIYLDAQEREENVRPLSNAQEDYKREVARRAAGVLNPKAWTIEEIGKGTIGDLAIKVVQRHQNLVGQFQVFTFANTVRDDYSISEKLLFDLYHERKDKECFSRACDLFGKKYDLIAYLYFVLDPNTYLPLRSSIFDKVFNNLGIDLKTTGRCSWDNYQAFLRIIASVRDYMKDYYQISDVDLLDAHSFLWTINSNDWNTKEESQDLEEVLTTENKGHNTRVIHNYYGEGVIDTITNEKVYVIFGEKLRIFPYPDAFEKEYLKKC